MRPTVGDKHACKVGLHWVKESPERASEGDGTYMHIRTVSFILAMLVFSGCDDDPIIGPSDDDTGGGSYGVIHFHTSPDESGIEAADIDTLTKENPKRF